MRFAVALLSTILLAPVPLFWAAFATSGRPTQFDAPGGSRSRAAAQEFAELRREYDEALRRFHQEMASVDPAEATEVYQAMHPGVEFLPRFLALAEKYPDHPLSRHIAMFALSVAGPCAAPADHQRAQAILFRHHGARAGGKDTPMQVDHVELISASVQRLGSRRQAAE
jgi:hypothetical protein